MAHPREVVDEWVLLSRKLATDIASKPTGVTPGYSAALGGTVTEDGRISYVGGAKEQLYPAIAHVGDVTTCVEDTVTRVGFTSLEYDPKSQLSFDDLQGTNWQFSTLFFGSTEDPDPPDKYFQIGCRVFLKTPESGEEYEPGDNFTLSIFRFDEDGDVTTQVAQLDTVLITQDLGGFGYVVSLQGSAVLPVVRSTLGYYYVGLYNDSRFDRIINGTGAPWRSQFWAIPVT